MKSEVHFFMTKEDQEEFMQAFKNKINIIVNNGYYLELKFGKNQIQFDPSEWYENSILAGRIAYMTIDDMDNDAEKIYKEMKKYIIKNYMNNMNAINKMNNSESIVKTFYYSQRIQLWLSENEENILLQFKNGFVIFKPYLPTTPNARTLCEMRKQIYDI